MNLPVLALFLRSVRMDTRAISTYLLRILLVGVVLLALSITVESARHFGAPGLFFFNFVVWTNLFLITLAMLPYFTSVITEEKEDMTLGLLRMTNLSSMSILLGKSASRLLGAMMLLAVQAPFTLLAITLGGVSLDQIVAAYAAMSAYIVLIAGLGVFCSVVSGTTRDATALAAISLFLFHVGPWIVHGIVESIAAIRYLDKTAEPWVTLMLVVNWTKELSIFKWINAVMGLGFAQSALGLQVISNLIIGGFLFLLAYVAFERFNRESKTASPDRGVVFKRTSKLARIGVGRAWAMSIAWKEFHFNAGGYPIMLVKLVGYSLLSIWMISMNYQYQQRIDWEELGAIIGFMIAFIGWFELTALAGSMFGEEARWKTLSSLTLLPQSVASIAYAKLAGILIAMLPSLFFIAIGIGLAWDDFWDGFENASDEPAFWFFVFLVPFIPHLSALYSLYISWGAAFLAIGTTILGLMIMGFMAGTAGADEDPVFTLFATFLLIGNVAMHFMIGNRIRQVAAQ